MVLDDWFLLQYAQMLIVVKFFFAFHEYSYVLLLPYDYDCLLLVFGFLNLTTIKATTINM